MNISKYKIVMIAMIKFNLESGLKKLLYKIKNSSNQYKDVFKIDKKYKQLKKDHFKNGILNIAQYKTIEFELIDKVEKVIDSLTFGDLKGFETDDEGMIKFYIEKDLTVNELNSFLSKIERVYNSLYYFTYLEFGESLLDDRILKIESIPTERVLKVNKLSLSSPGFFEFIGSLNPLQQIRDFLKDRHERKKDDLYKNNLDSKKGEVEIFKLTKEIELLNISKEKKVIENLLLREDLLKERIQTMKSLGYSEMEMRKILSTYIIQPLVDLHNFEEENNVVKKVDVKKRNRH